MNNRPAELDEFFSADIPTKSEALKSLDKAAIVAMASLAVITTVVISLVFFSL